MSSRVISIRLNSETIAQSLLLLQKHKMHIEGMPMSRAVKIVLETIILQQERSGNLEEMDGPTADVFLANHADEVMELSPSMDFGGALESVVKSERVETAVSSDGERLARALHEARTPKVTKPVSVFEENTDSLPLVESNGQFWNVPYMALADINEIAPKDTVVNKFLEEVAKGKGSPNIVKTMQRCIEIVYKQRPTSEWGTPSIHRMINNLFQDNM